MGALAGLVGGGGIPGSGQTLSPRARSVFQTQAIAESRQPVRKGKANPFGGITGSGLSANAARRVNEQIALRNSTQPFNRLVSQSQLGAEFRTKDLKRAKTNRDLFSQFFGGRTQGGASSGGRASFLGASSTPSGSRSFTSLLRGF